MVICVVCLNVCLELLIEWYDLLVNVILILIIGKFRGLCWRYFCIFVFILGIYCFGMILLIIVLLKLKFDFCGNGWMFKYIFLNCLWFLFWCL